MTFSRPRGRLGGDRPGAGRWGRVPSGSTIATCVLAGFVVPWLTPVEFVRQCPDELRHSFPLLFAIDRPHAEGSTLLVGVAANTALWASLLLAAVLVVRTAPQLAGVAGRLRRNRRNLLSLLIPATALILLTGVDQPTLSTAIGPGHVDTEACGHVTGHTRTTNWWGPDRFQLLDLDRLIP